MKDNNNIVNPLLLAHNRMLAHQYEEDVKNGICPQCSSKLVYIEGCNSCMECGWSACDN